MKLRRLIIIFGSILAILAITGVVLFGREYLKTRSELEALKKNPQQAAQTEAKALIEKLGKLIILPTDEEPTVATISDTTQLANQPFFVNAKNGDKVIIYAKAKKVYLYDPKANMILDVAPLNISTTQGPTPTIVK